MKKEFCCARQRMPHRLLKKLLQDKRAIVGLCLVAMICVIALLAPFISPNDPLEILMKNKLQLPSKTYWLGTDNLGRCIASRIIWGTRSSLLYAAIVLSLMLLISIPLGLLAGYAGGIVDTAIMRVTDICMAFPSSILALAVTGMLGANVRNLIIAMACVWWSGYARLIRGLVLQIKEQDFVLASQAAGCSKQRIVFYHVLRNVLSPIIVLATLEVGTIILAIAGFSFIGLGAQPPAPEWGVMLSDSRQYIQTQPQLMIYPGAAIMVTVIAFNLLGEGLKEAMER